jgi:hypothetical protein
VDRYLSTTIKKTKSSVIYELVDEWTRSENHGGLKRRVDEWTKTKSRKEKS